MIFRKWGGVKGRLEFFRKFIRFGDAIRPLPEFLCKPLALLWCDRGLSFCFQGSCSRLILPQLHLIWDHEMMQNDGRTILDCHGSYWFKSSGRWTNFAVCILVNYACPTIEKAELKFHHVSQLRCSLEEMSEHLKVYTAYTTSGHLALSTLVPTRITGQCGAWCLTWRKDPCTHKGIFKKNEIWTQTSIIHFALTFS